MNGSSDIRVLRITHMTLLDQFQDHQGNQVTATYISINLTKMCYFLEVVNKILASFTVVCAYG